MVRQTAMQVRKFMMLAALVLTGCQAPHYSKSASPGEDNWQPTVVKTGAVHGHDGSLFAPQQVMTLFQDRRAYRVGDILTVVLNEQTQSSKRSDTAINKNSGVGIAAPVFGNETVNDMRATIDADRDFSGGATASQQNSLTGFITVTVSDVMANGVLAIKGEKWIRLNQGDEYVRLRGLVRVDDIDENNYISSQRVADAQITYAGRGSLADANQPGWLTRFFQSPLFPF